MVVEGASIHFDPRGLLGFHEHPFVFLHFFLFKMSLQLLLVGGATGAKVGDVTGAKVGDVTGAKVGGRTGAKVGDRTGAKVGDRTGAFVGGVVGGATGAGVIPFPIVTVA